jgi:Helix-turn-helix domain
VIHFTVLFFSLRHGARLKRGTCGRTDGHCLRDLWAVVAWGPAGHTPRAVQERSEPLDLIGQLLPRLEALGMSDVAQRLAALTQTNPVGVPSDLNPSDLLSLAEAAELLGLRSPSTVRSLAEAGELEAYWHAGEELVIDRRSAEAYLQSPRLVGQRRLEAQIWSALDDLF